MLSEPLLAAYCAFGAVSLSLYVCVIRAILTSPLRKNSVYKLMVALGAAVGVTVLGENHHNGS